MTLMTLFRNNKKYILMATISLSVVIILAIVILLVIFLSGNNSRARASVVTSGYGCSEIGINILEKGGNAVDAAIAALFCDGVSVSHSMGLGGGFLLTVFKKSTGEIWSLNSREVAPSSATLEMYTNSEITQKGGLAVAVPGELIGYWHMYNKFGGSLPWKDLVQPTIDLCKNGIYVTAGLAARYESNRQTLFSDPVLREIFFDPKTNDTYKEGQHIYRPRLARTLEIIASEGGMALHNGSLTESFVNDIKEHNGIVTIEDMNNYEPEWQKPLQSSFNGQLFYSAPLPGSGSVLLYILNILEGFLNLDKPFTVTNYQRIIESFKFAYAMRSKLGDPNFANVSKLVSNFTSKGFAEEIRKLIFDNQTFDDPAYYGADQANVEDHGTAHISVLAPNGDAVSVTSTINGVFGAKFASNSTGIILNNEMDDFFFPHITNLYGISLTSPANLMQPGKRPLSSMCPTIIIDENKDVVLVVGAAGGSKITTSVAQIIINHLWFGLDLETSMKLGRVHHQLLPMTANFENEFEQEYPAIVNGIRAIGHNVVLSSVSDGFAAATAISNKCCNSLTGVCDTRRPGYVSYIY